MQQNRDRIFKRWKGGHLIDEEDDHINDYHANEHRITGGCCRKSRVAATNRLYGQLNFWAKERDRVREREWKRKKEREEVGNRDRVLQKQNQLCSYKTASCFCPYIYLRLEKKSSRREILTAQHSTPNKSSCKFDTGFAAAKTKRSFVAATLIVPLRVCLPFMRLLKMHNALQQTQICMCKRDLCSEKCS